MKGGYHGYLKFVLDEIYPEWHLSPFSTQPFIYVYYRLFHNHKGCMGYITRARGPHAGGRNHTTRKVVVFIAYKLMTSQLITMVNC